MAVYSRVVALDQSWARSHLTFMIILLDNVIFQTRPHTNRIKKGSKYSTQKTFLTILGKYLGFKSLKKTIFYAWGRRAVKFGQVLLAVCPLRCLQETVRACDTRWLWLHPHHRSPSTYVRDPGHTIARQKCSSLCGLNINKSQHMEASVDQAQTTRKVCFTLSFSSVLNNTGLGIALAG